MRARSRPRGGQTLLEVIVALAILGVAGAAAMSLALDTGMQLRRAQEADVRTAAASDFLHAVALWTRDDLDRHLGDRVQGGWRMRVTLASPALYEVELRDSTGQRALLRTALHRPGPDAQP